MTKFNTVLPLPENYLDGCDVMTTTQSFGADGYLSLTKGETEISPKAFCIVKVI
jgi:hypothetical protein